MDSTALETSQTCGNAPAPGDFPAYDGRPAARGGRHADEAHWLHELSNEVNTAAVAAVVLRRMLERGQVEQALQLTRELDGACSRCSGLVHARFRSLS